MSYPDRSAEVEPNAITKVPVAFCDTGGTATKGRSGGQGDCLSLSSKGLIMLIPGEILPRAAFLKFRCDKEGTLKELGGSVRLAWRR